MFYLIKVIIGLTSHILLLWDNDKHVRLPVSECDLDSDKRLTNANYRNYTNRSFGAKSVMGKIGMTFS